MRPARDMQPLVPIILVRRSACHAVFMYLFSAPQPPCDAGAPSPPQERRDAWPGVVLVEFATVRRDLLHLASELHEQRPRQREFEVVLEHEGDPTLAGLAR